ncbi:uncharacterized protein LOC116371447 isoform X1 [Oncorhynchus kisutch]|uniref:uncharacterized protein LOC116371447 isoform X1 n=1 Tax=Oncorhynchus kisutch TaxID=8019 RepID=UPI0012DC3534|nr:uncharacterized protein LOC116371447 isoform X1 [Oncorhynchus kisutch]
MLFWCFHISSLLLVRSLSRCCFGVSIYPLCYWSDPYLDAVLVFPYILSAIGQIPISMLFPYILSAIGQIPISMLFWCFHISSLLLVRSLSRCCFGVSIYPLCYWSDPYLDAVLVFPYILSAIGQIPISMLFPYILSAIGQIPISMLFWCFHISSLLLVRSLSRCYFQKSFLLLVRSLSRCYFHISSLLLVRSLSRCCFGVSIYPLCYWSDPYLDAISIYPLCYWSDPYLDAILVFPYILSAIGQIPISMLFWCFHISSLLLVRSLSRCYFGVSIYPLCYWSDPYLDAVLVFPYILSAIGQIPISMLFWCFHISSLLLVRSLSRCCFGVSIYPLCYWSDPYLDAVLVFPYILSAIGQIPISMLFWCFHISSLLLVRSLSRCCFGDSIYPLCYWSEPSLGAVLVFQ